MTEQSKACLAVALSTSSPTISLSNRSVDVLQLIVTTRIDSSSNPSSAVTLCTNRSVMDNGEHERHDGLFSGAFLALRSTTQPERSIPLAFAGTPNYGSVPDASIDCRERPWMHFETVPARGKGDLIIKHSLSLDRVFQNSSSLNISDIQPGEKFGIRMNPKRLVFADWWSFGDLDGELGKKKFAIWEPPDKDGKISNLMPGQSMPDVQQMEREGWVFSEGLDYLEATDVTDHDVVVEFVE